MGLVQVVDAAQLVEHRAPELQAVVDLRGQREVGERHRQVAVLAVQVYAADQVGVVLALREPARGGGGRAASPTARTPTSRSRAGRMNASAWTETKRSALHAPRLLHAHVQRNEVVPVARQHGAHVGLLVDALLQLARDRERHVLLVGAAAAARAGILAAVPGIHRDDDEAARRRARFAAARRGARRPASARAAASRRRPASRARRRLLALRLVLFEEREQRIGRNEGIEIEHQPVAVVADRREREDLRLHLALQIEHEPHHVGLEAPDAHAFHVRIGRADLVREPGQRRGDIDALRSSTRRSGSFSVRSVCLTRRRVSSVTRV